MAKSYNEKVVSAFFASHGIVEPEYEYKFCETRRWKMDIAWNFWTMVGHGTGEKGGICIEVQGGLFMRGGGRHNRGAAMLKEYEKLNEAAALGWRVLFVTPQQLMTAQTASLIKRALGL
jgi:hypothetical protein